jgi:hypothetical protein
MVLGFILAKTGGQCHKGLLEVVEAASILQEKTSGPVFPLDRTG